jgi:hypothetical protein
MCPQFLRFILRLKFWNCYDIVITFLFHLISDQWLDVRKKSLKIPKGVIRIRKSKKNRQHNAQKKKYKRTNNDLQNIHIKLKIE